MKLPELVAEYIDDVILPNHADGHNSAEKLANWGKKGALIGVTGRIQTRSYDNQQGQKIYVTEIIADNFQMLEKRQEGGNNHDTGVLNNQTTNNATRNQNGAQGNLGRFNDSPFGGNSIDINDDSLPF